MNERARAAVTRVGLALLLAVVATVPALLVGFWIKDRCTTHNWDGYQYRTSCYNDIFALYGWRGLADGRFPYVNGDGDDEPAPGQAIDDDGDLEYPVGTGLFMGAVAQLVSDGQAFFRANAAGLGVAAVAASGVLFLTVTDRRRVLFFALAPSLALYAFHNWDLLAVALMVGGLYAFARGSDGWSGALLGLGAATKLFPGLLLPGLALVRWRQTRRVPWLLVGASAAGFLVVNLPILLLNPEGWLYPWRFQSTRPPNFETSWYMLLRHFGEGAGADGFWWRTYPSLTGLASGALFAVGAGVLLWIEARRERMRPFALSFGILLIFLLTAKVYSPQFALWLLPFFALVRIHWGGFVAFAVTDAAVWAAISAFFLAHGEPLEDARLDLVEAAVYLRYAALGALLWLSSRSDENVAVPDERARAERARAPVEFLA